MATPAAGSPEKYSFLPIRPPSGTPIFVFGSYLRRHPLDNHPKTRMLGHQEGSSSSGPSKGVDMQAYCLKCRTKREMRDPRQTTLKNGRPATQGTCPVCGTKMYRIGKG